MFDIPDHPDIDHAMRFGYPHRNHVDCEICGIDITYDYKYQTDDFDYLCEDCYNDLVDLVTEDEGAIYSTDAFEEG